MKKIFLLFSFIFLFNSQIYCAEEQQIEKYQKHISQKFRVNRTQFNVAMFLLTAWSMGYFAKSNKELLLYGILSAAFYAYVCEVERDYPYNENTKNFKRGLLAISALMLGASFCEQFFS